MSSDKKSQLTMFGSINSPGGALAIISGFDGAAELWAQTEIFTLKKKGVLITPEIELEISRAKKDFSISMKKRYESQGVPQKFVDLFEKTKKKDAETYCKEIEIDKSDLTLIGLNHEQIGFQYRVKHLKFHPDHLKPSKEEKEAFKKNGVGEFKTDAAKKFVRKTAAMFSERRYVSVHLFENKHMWHLFYFSYEDAFQNPLKGPNHWKYGTHIHYVSYLWELDKETVWESLDERKVKMKSAHIKFAGNEEETG